MRAGKRLVRPLIVALCTCLACIRSQAFGWSYKEHIQLTRIAVARLLADPETPAEMRDWLRQAVPDVPDLAGEREFLMTARVGDKPSGFDGLLYWAYVADVHARTDPRESTVEPFGVHERLLHFIDVEYFQPPEQRKGYRHDLSGKPPIDRIPRDVTDPRFRRAGLLPFRVEQCYQELVRSIRDGRLHAATADAQRGQTATYWAGYLAHYLADGTQPHHASLDYKSQSYFANRRKAPNVHAELEFRMVDDEHEQFPELRAEYWTLFAAALKTDYDPVAPVADPWRASLEASLISYDALPLIGAAAMKAAGQAGTPDAPRGDVTGAFDLDVFMRHRDTFQGREMSVMEMKAHQTAWAVRRIERTLRQAWEEARGK